MRHQPCQHCKYASSVDIQKLATEKLVTHVESNASAVSLLKSGQQHYIKAIYNNNTKATPKCYALHSYEGTRDKGLGIAQWLKHQTHDQKVPRFRLLQKWQEKLLLQGQLSVLILILASVPPPCYHSSM